MKSFIGLLLCLGVIIISLLPQQINGKTRYGYKWEEYNAALFNRLQTVDDLIGYCDSAVGSQNRQSVEYNEFLGRLLRKRFYHGYSYYSFKDNPFAYLAGKIIWQDLSAIVIPNDIMKYPMAACSQQAIIRKACFEKIGIPFRKIALKGHFVLEGMIDGEWYLFDSNLEPEFSKGRKSLKNLMSTGEIYTSYRNRKTMTELNSIFSNPKYGKVNGYFAINATLFQYCSKIVFYLLPFLGLFFFVAGHYKKKASNQVSHAENISVDLYENQKKII